MELPHELVQEAAVCGLDPMEGWDRTPGELIEYILAARERDKRRREELGSLAYQLGVHVCRTFAGKGQQPWMAFRGFLEMPEQSEDELWAVLSAWAEFDPDRVPDEAV